MGLQVVHPRIFNVFVQIHIRRCKKKKICFDERWWWCLALWSYPACKLNWCKTGRHAYTLFAVCCTRRNCNKDFCLWFLTSVLSALYLKLFFFKIYLFRCCYVKTLSFDWPDRSSPEWEDGRTKTGNVQEKCSLKMSVSRVSLKNLKLKLKDFTWKVCVLNKMH